MNKNARVGALHKSAGFPGTDMVAPKIEVNTLVTHKTKFLLGICCVSKVHKNNIVTINVGRDDTMKVSTKNLSVVDTSKCETITIAQINSDFISRKLDKGPGRIIVGNELKEFVGFGFVHIKVVTLEDLKKYKRLV